MAWNDYAPYVSVAERRKKAEREVARRRKKGETITPVQLEGKKIATTFWGKAWCDHLEGYSDYENRLPRGRTYVRNGSVVHLAITAGGAKGLVQGTELYEVTITITPLAPPRWTAIIGECSGKIDSLVELLQGKLSSGVMEVVTHREKGLFPAPAQIRMKCTCPDAATMCKHVAAVLYGVGARLDQQPELLFLLRQVDHLALIDTAAIGKASAKVGKARKGAKAIADTDLASVFGIELETGAVDKPPRAAKPAPKRKVPASPAPAAAAPKPTAKRAATSAQKPAPKRARRA